MVIKDKINISYEQIEEGSKTYLLGHNRRNRNNTGSNNGDAFGSFPFSGDKGRGSYGPFQDG